LLGLDRLSPLDQALRDQVLTLSRDRVADAVDTIGARYQFDHKLVGEVSKAYAETASTNPDSANTSELRSDLYPMLLGLVALANHERDLVRYQFAERTISGTIVEQLLANVGRLVDRTRAEGRIGYLRASQRMVQFSRRFRAAHFIHRRLRIDGPLVDSLADRFELLLVNGIVLTELAPYVDEKLTPLLGESVTPQLHEILHQRQDMTGAALEALRQQYPSYADLLERRFLNRFALRREDNEYRTLFEEGVIGPELHSSLRREITIARSEVELRPRLDLGLETRELIAKVPMFANLSREQLDAVAHLLRPRFALPDEQLIHKGDRADAMYFISSGVVEVDRGPTQKKIKLGRGDFTGEMALVSGKRRQADVFARSYCQLLVLKEDDFQRLFKNNPEIKAVIDKESDARFEMNRRARDAATD
jgi:Na+:H+ antiporter